MIRTFVILPVCALFWGAAHAVNICLEAEGAFTNVAPMAIVNVTNPPAGIKGMAGASGNAYLEVPLKAGKAKKDYTGSATIRFEVPSDGAYTLWARACWEGECSNTLLVQIDNLPPFLVGSDSTFHAWHWVKYPVSRMASPPTLAKGRHTLTIIHREDGVRLDQVLFSSNPRFVPVDIEKPGDSP